MRVSAGGRRARWALRLTPACLAAALLAILAPGAVAASARGATASARAAAASARAATASAPVPEVLAAAPAELTYGSPLVVSGRAASAGAGLAGRTLALLLAPYPYRRWHRAARTLSGAGGSFAFAPLRADRDTRARVLLEGSPATLSQTLAVSIDARAALGAHARGPGQTRLSVRIAHTRFGGSGSVAAWWFVAPAGRDDFRLVAVTASHELAPGLTYASAIVAPPARSFAFRVCLNPPWERAMAAPGRHHACRERDFDARGIAGPATEYSARARGIPLAAFPSYGAIAACGRLLAARAGRTAFAVVDSSGRLQGVRVHEHFHSASVVKVMMLTAFLQMLQARHRPLSAFDSSLLYPMIHVSDNAAASRVLAIIGAGALAGVARQVGMSDYAPARGWWALTQTSAADQAKLFFTLDRLIPPRFYGYARSLLSGIDRSQSWGIPAVARPRWSVYFKGGWLPSEGLFNQAARLERPGVRFSLAVLTSGDPSMAYGVQTIAGLASVLAGGPLRAAPSAFG